MSHIRGAFLFEIGIRHQTKANCGDFGEEEMKDWWRERDYIGWIPEKNISRDMTLEETADRILQEVMCD